MLRLFKLQQVHIFVDRHTSHTASLLSKNILCNEEGHVLSSGYNNSPSSSKTCGTLKWKCLKMSTSLNIGILVKNYNMNSQNKSLFYNNFRFLNSIHCF